jgi:hypothetical protein
MWLATYIIEHVVSHAEEAKLLNLKWRSETLVFENELVGKREARLQSMDQLFRNAVIQREYKTGIKADQDVVLFEFEQPPPTIEEIERVWKIRERKKLGLAKTKGRQDPDSASPAAPVEIKQEDSDPRHDMAVSDMKPESFDAALELTLLEMTNDNVNPSYFCNPRMSGSFKRSSSDIDDEDEDPNNKRPRIEEFVPNRNLPLRPGSPRMQAQTADWGMYSHLVQDHSRPALGYVPMLDLPLDFRWLRPSYRDDEPMPEFTSDSLPSYHVQ